MKSRSNLFLYMKRRMQAVVLFVALYAGFIAHAADAPAGPPLFPDKKLEAAVRHCVFEKRDNDKPLVESDVVNISTIEAKGAGITDLTGLEKCQSLALLDLASNHVSRLEALKGLTKLQSLNLAANQVQELDPLAGVLALQYLELSHNQVRDLRPLRGLTNLVSLYLGDNAVTDLTPLLALPKLTSLYLENNQVASIEGMNQLKRLATLSLRGNAVCDLSPLHGLQSLSWLFLEKNKIRDLGPLVQMAKEDREQRFAPFLKLYIADNPLGDTAAEQIAALKQVGVRVHQ